MPPQALHVHVHIVSEFSTYNAAAPCMYDGCTASIEPLGIHVHECTELMFSSTLCIVHVATCNCTVQLAL